MADPTSDTFSLLSLSPDQDPASKSVFDEYSEHMSSPSADFDTWFTSVLREHHPDLTVTVSPTPLLFYASIGYAKAELDTTDSEVLRWRYYLPPARRELPGGLGDVEFFAKYKYTWMAEEYIVYAKVVGYSTLFYILKEPDKENGEDTMSHCAKTDKLLLAIGDYAVALHQEILVYDGYWQKNRALWEEVQKTGWDDVILDDEMKKTLTGTVERFFDSRDTYKQLDVPWKRGLIFHGPAGNGKTISLKALMHSLSVRKVPIPTLYVKSMRYTYDIRSVFIKARQMSPCLLILEDIDTVIGATNRSYFFNEVDGLEDNDGILMIATTNHLERLDPGLSKRPSRFDRKYKFNIPTRNERIMYCDFWRRKLKSSKSIKFPKKLSAAIADITYDFSFAYLKEAFIATLLVIAGKSDDPTESDDEEGGGDDGIDDLVLWVEMKKQVQLLRDDMDNSDDPEEVQVVEAPPPPAPLPGAWPRSGLLIPDGGEGSVAERLERLKIQMMRGMARRD